MLVRRFLPYSDGTADNGDDKYNGQSFMPFYGPGPATATSQSLAPTPNPTPPPTTVLVVNEINAQGNTVVVIQGAETATKTLGPGGPLPSAETTLDPLKLLKQQSGSSTPSSSASSTYGYGYPVTTSDSTMATSTPSGSPTSPAAAQKSSPPPVTEDKSHGSLPIGAMVVIPLGVIAILVGAFFFMRGRRSSRRGHAGAISSREMKMRSPEEGLANMPPGYSESTSGPLLMSTASGTRPEASRTTTSLAPTLTLNHSSSRPPVIVDTNMGSAYFTGLDTSDAVSMSSAANHAGAGRESFDSRRSARSDEPPPPYRPRSVPSISRDSSVRHPPSGGLAVDTAAAVVNPFDEGDLGSGLGRGNHDHDDDDDDDATPTVERRVRDPFADPEEDDDFVTPVQSPLMRSHDDNRSEVSALSFDDEERRR